MNLKNSALKLLNSEPAQVNYHGPYVVKPRGVEIKVLAPATYEDATECADSLIDGCVVLISYERLDGKLNNYVFDYMNGVSTVIGAKVSTVQESLLLYTPSHIAAEDGR